MPTQIRLEVLRVLLKRNKPLKPLPQGPYSPSFRPQEEQIKFDVQLLHIHHEAHPPLHAVNKPTTSTSSAYPLGVQIEAYI